MYRTYDYMSCVARTFLYFVHRESLKTSDLRPQTSDSRPKKFKKQFQRADEEFKNQKCFR